MTVTLGEPPSLQAFSGISIKTVMFGPKDEKNGSLRKDVNLLTMFFLHLPNTQ